MSAADGTSYAWGNAAFAFGNVLIRAFALSGWFADIRGIAAGADSGGVIDLPAQSFGTDRPGTAVKCSVDSIISEARDKELSDLGFITLCDCEDTEYSAFFANQSIQKPKVYHDEVATTNARISSMLQYVLCASRFAHYLKVIGRDKIGQAPNRGQLESLLHNWVQQYVAVDPGTSAATRAKYPLREAKIEIDEHPADPGHFRLKLFLAPHVQLDQLSAGIRLVTALLQDLVTPDRRHPSWTLYNSFVTATCKRRSPSAPARCRATPAKPDPRDLLSQLLCFTGEYERADKHLETLGAQFPDRAPGRQPDPATDPRRQGPATILRRRPACRSSLRGRPNISSSTCRPRSASAKAKRRKRPACWPARRRRVPASAGRCNGQPFQDLRDADDFTAAFLEVFTTTGKYYWIPLENIRRILLHPVESPLDVLWRRCQIQATACSEGIVYVPQLYAGTFRAEDESLRLGRSTEWFGPDEGPVRGVGHRILWIDDDHPPLRGDPEPGD